VGTAANTRMQLAGAAVSTYLGSRRESHQGGSYLNRRTGLRADAPPPPGGAVRPARLSEVKAYYLRDMAHKKAAHDMSGLFGGR